MILHKRVAFFSGALFGLIVGAFLLKQTISRVQTQRERAVNAERAASIKWGMELIAIELKDILRQAGPITNRVALVEAFNKHNTSNFVSFPLRSSGNPCPELLKPSTYCWRTVWDLSEVSATLPVMWTHIDHYPDVYLGISPNGDLLIYTPEQWSVLDRHLGTNRVCFDPPTPSPQTF